MNLGSLVSEARNPQTLDLDALSTLELVNRFNQQDTLVAQAVKETLPVVAKAGDAAAAALKAGGMDMDFAAQTVATLSNIDAEDIMVSREDKIACAGSKLTLFLGRA